MGIFGKILEGGGKIVLSEQDAFIAVATIAVYADGFKGGEEIHATAVALAKMKMFQGYDYDFNIPRVHNIIQHHGVGPTIKAAKKALSPNMRETAFALAADIALSDGRLDKTENEYLTQLHKGLGISGRLANKIIDVILIKNRG